MENLTIPNPLENITNNISKKDKEGITDILGKIMMAICIIAIIAVPLIFVPLFADQLELPKQLLIFFLGMLGVLLWSVKNVINGKFIWTKSNFDLPILLMALFAVVSSVLSPNLYSSLSAETVVLVGGAALYFLFAATPQKEQTVNKFSLVLSGIAGILGLFLVFQTLYALIAPAAKLNINLFLLNPGFNPAGSALAAGLFIAAVLPIAIGLLKNATGKEKVLAGPLLVLIAAGIISAVVLLYQNRPILLDHQTGWKVATGVLGESVQTALLGIGSGNLVDAFTAYKPASFNGSDFWNLRFSTSSNFYLSTLTSLGIIGLALLILYVVKFIKIARARIQLDNTTALEKGLIGSIAVILVFGLIFPTPTLSLFLLFVVSGILMAHYRLSGVSLYSKNEESEKKNIFGYALTVGLLIITIGGGYFLGTFAIGDYYFAQSLQAAAANQGRETYDYQIKALGFNPYNSNYRISYSQTNLALANSLAGQPNLTDEQKQTVVTLVQQAIREARIAAALAPRRASAWENLSLVYRNLINFAQGSDQWAVASQNQASQLDPTNPRLLLDLGGIFFAAGDYQNAAQIFNQAVNLKPDFANAHYNLAQALKGLGQNQLAVQELQTTSTLVCAAVNGKVDCDRVNAEIDELNKIIASPEATPSAQVNPEPNTDQEPLATPGATQSNLPAAAPTPAPQVSSESGELQQ